MLLDLILSRRSIRRYKPDPVPRELIEKCVEAARHAPSADNFQPWKFIVVDDPALRDRLADASFSGIYAFTGFASKAPVLVACLVKPNVLTKNLPRLQGTHWYVLDMGIAGEHFVLQATELGLGTCWIGWYNKKGVRKTLDIPRGWDIAYLLSVGYPAGKTKPPRPRKPLNKILSYNQFKDASSSYTPPMAGRDST